MRKERYFIPNVLKKNTLVFLKDDEFHHLKVMRNKEKERIELINNRCQLAEGIIQKIQKDHAEVFIEQIQEFSPPSAKKILIQAFIKQSNLELITEKATELGITDLFFLSCRSFTSKTTVR